MVEWSPETLSDREREICLLVAEGMTCGAIAFQLKLSSRTVETHIYSAARQLPGKGTPMKKIMRLFNSLPRETT